MSDIYQAPSAELRTPVSNNEYGSVERGLSGDYEFTIGGALSEAWEKTAGRKGTFNLAMLLYVVVAILLSIGTDLLVTAISLTVPEPIILIASSLTLQILINLILLPAWAGLIILGMRASVDSPITATMIFDHFRYALRLVGTLILMYLLILIGLVLLVLPGIYLIIAYSMALQLVVEKDMSPWQAMETSRKVVSKKWFTMFGFYIVALVITLVSALLLFIPLFWTLPMMIIASGLIYRNMFGLERSTIE